MKTFQLIPGIFFLISAAFLGASMPAMAGGAKLMVTNDTSSDLPGTGVGFTQGGGRSGWSISTGPGVVAPGKTATVQTNARIDLSSWMTTYDGPAGTRKFICSGEILAYASGPQATFNITVKDNGQSSVVVSHACQVSGFCSNATFSANSFDTEYSWCGSGSTGGGSGGSSSGGGGTSGSSSGGGSGVSGSSSGGTSGMGYISGAGSGVEPGSGGHIGQSGSTGLSPLPNNGSGMNSGSGMNNSSSGGGKGARP